MEGVYAIPITGFDYAEVEDGVQRGFVEVVDELIENKAEVPFRFIIIDTITALERYAIAYTIRKMSVKDKKRYTDISDIPWGAGYTAVAEAVYEQIDRLKKEGFGVLVIGHEKTKKITNKDGFEYDFTTFNVLGKTSDIIERESDLIIYGDMRTVEGKDGAVETERKLVFRSDGNVLAGSRFRNFPKEIVNDAKVFVQTFKDAVLGLYKGDEKAVEEAIEEQAKEAEEKTAKAKQAESETPEMFIDEISKLIEGFEKDQKIACAKFFAEELGNADYRKSEDVKGLKKSLEFAKGL